MNFSAILSVSNGGSVVMDFEARTWMEALVFVENEIHEALRTKAEMWTLCSMVVQEESC